MPDSETSSRHPGPVNLMGACSRLTAFFTRLAGLDGVMPSSTAWLCVVERTPCITPTVLGLRPSSILRALKARTRLP
jgi:hypothetical protein